MKKKVFIAWNGDNLQIAKKVGEKIQENDFTAIIGGGSSSNRFVGDTVINQMNQAEMAIIIIEKVTITKKSFKLSENVMYEWGYLNAKINNPEKIRVFLINTSTNDLPSDVKGFWVSKIQKPELKNSNEAEKEKIYNETAENISNTFLKDTNKIKQTNKDKLQYLVHWNENKHEIYNYNGYSQISEKLLYGMQVAIYSNEIEQLINALETLEAPSTELRAIINCAKAMLTLFHVTNKLTRKLSLNDYTEIKDSLNINYEDNIADADLKSWCRILRKDKLQLCHQYTADNSPNPKRYLEKSLSQAKEVINLIKIQCAEKPSDKYFALLFLSFQYRNMAEIHHKLHLISPNEYSIEAEKDYRELSYKTRDELRKYYRQTYSDDMIFDNLLQEYILSLIEYYPFVNDTYLKEDITNFVKSSIKKWNLQIDRKNFVLNEINKKAKAIMNIERE